ncbi:hypothetical protein [Aureispira anguillae]|uniref:Glycosyltransferase RgtA/B/C/D-like domain-containing protein n=1 Tax=Aureispira anguillae TaxID=2864201 RepID=A0A915YHH4_9BACT|nr:hypothetical protein [Aureispira anguillae]BDS13280.1 hypothetical protein AsAng_0040100 [Aureispira anguillae]
MYAKVVIILCIAVYYTIGKTEYRAKNANPFIYDQAGYYNYLPAFFIYKDLNFNYLNNAPPASRAFISSQQHKAGHSVNMNRYSTGIAFLLSPFFGLAHLQAYLSGAPPDGFSAPYQSWIYIGHFFYLLIAFFLLRQILSFYYKDPIIAWTIGLIGLGTNLAYYAIYEPLMSHNYSFFLFSLSLFLAIKWLNKQQNSTLLLLGFTIGLLANTRLTNLIFVLVLMLWNASSYNALKERFLLLLKHWKVLLLAFGIGCIPFLPQLWYWQHSTGHWLVNSYGAQSVFFWADPMIGEILWGYKKGWLLYSPLMLFAVVGLGFLYQQFPKIFWSIFLYTLLNWYIISCWWCWWYGGSFGMRPLIESMAPLSLAVAAFLHWAFQSKRTKIPMVGAIVLGIGLNAFQSYQYSYNCIDSFGMTRKAYWIVFGQLPPLSPSVAKEYDKSLLGVYMNQMTIEDRNETKTYNERIEMESE